MEKLKQNATFELSTQEDISIATSAETLITVKNLSRQLDAEHLYIITLRNVFDVDEAEQLSPDALCDFLSIMKNLLNEIIKDTEHPVSDFNRTLH